MNGRSVDRFLQEDLKKIHTVIESAKVDGKAVDIAKLNKILAKQLSGVLNLNSQQSNTPAIKETDNVESQNVSSVKNTVTKEQHSVKILYTGYTIGVINCR